MDERRRQLIHVGSALAALSAAGLACARAAAAGESWNAKAFKAKDLEGVLQALGVSEPRSIDAMGIDAPDVAEDGTQVRITVASQLPDTRYLSVLVDENPTVLIARFEVPAGTEPRFTLRIKMRETSRIYVLAEVGDQFFMTSRLVRVILGGCGP
ncbi:MAG TPA: thiosulfate oxidation carrier protein SoxY [Burkholderiaceae bacterium]|nr:thiosulfate oxidation carrier protein SoxY [Burkholderiaceae bacterium]